MSFTQISYRILLLLMATYGFYANAQEADSTEQEPKVVATYGNKGFELKTTDNNYLMHLEWRIQTRLAAPYENDPITLEDLSEDRTYIGVNRARMKVGGHAYRPNFKYYLEYELFVSKLLDFRVMYELSKGFNLKVGQFKAHYTRERVISSGKQQTVDRSILNYAFTLDRQQGASLYGRLDGSGAADFNYWISMFMGTGRGATENDDQNLLWMSRIQWNPLGTPVPFTGSSLNRDDPMKLSISVAGATNRSQFTRFSTSGGGQLDGFAEGVPGQYRVNQLMFETVGMVKGFSWQQELHWKQIEDKVNLRNTELIGNYFQLGYFFSESFDWFPRRLELFGRYSIYDPDNNIPDNFRTETTLGANWFINGHRNKLTVGYNFLKFKDDPEALRDGSRVRIQWDVSF